MGKKFVVLDWESGPWDSTLYIALDDGYGTLEYADFTARRSVQGIPGSTERRVLQNINALGITVVSVAHRPDAIDRAQQVICLSA